MKESVRVRRNVLPYPSLTSLLSQSGFSTQEIGHQNQLIDVRRNVDKWMNDVDVNAQRTNYRYFDLKSFTFLFSWRKANPT